MALLLRWTPFQCFWVAFVLHGIILGGVYGWELFFQQQSILFGDSLTHSFPLNSYYSQSLHGMSSLFWSPEDSFGFPLAAEGQGAFFHPLNFLLFELLPLLTAHDLRAYLHLWLLASFAAAWLRSLGAHWGLSLLGSLWLCFAPGILGMFYNMAYLQTLSWGMATLWAFEEWQQKQKLFQQTGLAFCIALMCLSGYPQITYAVLLTLCVFIRKINLWIPLGITVLTGLALAAVQLLPLLELSQVSIRQASVDLKLAVPFEFFLRGLLSTDDLRLLSLGDPEILARMSPSVGSFLVVLLLPGLVITRNTNVLRVLSAAVLLSVLCVGSQSWLFQLLYDYVPGADRFRMTLPYLWVALPLFVAACVLLLNAMITHKWTQQDLTFYLFLSLAWTLACLGLFQYTHWQPEYAIQTFILISVWMVGALFCIQQNQPQRLLWVFGICVLWEVFVWKQNYAVFQSDALLQQNEQQHFLTQALKQANANSEHHVIHMPSHSMKHLGYDYLASPQEPHYEQVFNRFLQTTAPYLQLHFGIPMIRSHNALPLQQTHLAIERIHHELQAPQHYVPGWRLLDQMGIRFLLGYQASPELIPDDFQIVATSENAQLQLWENPNVILKPQWFAQASRVLWNEPLQIDVNLQKKPLQIQETSFNLIQRLMEPWLSALPKWMTHQEFELKNTQPTAGYWMLPVPYHPGWLVEVDGEIRSPYLANWVGQAVYLEPHQTKARFFFVPYTFYVGLMISLLTLFLLAIAHLRSKSNHTFD